MNKINWLNLLKASIVSTLLTLSLYGCTTTTTVVEEEDDDDLVTQVGPEPAWKEQYRRLSNRQLENRAIDALLAGNEQQALRYIEIIFEEEPNSYVGLLLEKQIISPPSDTLGGRYVVHAPAKGESLMDIAQRFTGEKLKFYAIARFNDIRVPSIVPQTLIKVPNNSGQYTPNSKRGASQPLSKKKPSKKKPSKKTTKPAVSEPKVVSQPAKPGLPVAEQAKKLFSDKSYSEVVALRESNITEFNVNPKIKEMAGKSYLVLAQNAFDKKDLDVASSRLAKAKQLNAPSDKVSELNSQIQVGMLLEKAKSQEKQGDLSASIDTYKVVLTMDADNRTATRQRSKLVNQLTKDYFQSSLKAREKGDNASELSLLNKILDINPTYQKAIQRKLIVEILIKAT